MEPFARPFNLTDLPPVEKQVPELIRVPSDEELVGVICSDQIWELPTHWHDGRTRPCTIASGQCALHESAPFRWYGLLCVYIQRKQRRVWVQLTAQAVQTLQLSLRERTDLLGRDVRIGRERKTLKSPVYVHVGERSHAGRQLSRGVEPHDTLARVFGTEARRPRQRKIA